MKVNTNRLNKFRYTLYAPGYDLVARLLNRSRQRSITLLDVQSGEKVLIVGAGTGLDLLCMPVGCEIFATDITPAMVRSVEKRNKNFGHNLHTSVMDGQKLIFPENMFDKVILHLILAVIPDPVQTLREAERVLKPGGRIAVYDKFVPQGVSPSRLRRFANLFTNLLFSNITRNAESIIAATDLQVVHDETADLGGMFRIILLEK
jgi:phosphatidylethanolamine/phosphatidyl-N-methylethanolamine N-methyltransferase